MFLAHLKSPMAAPVIEAALTLTEEPQANVARYDALLQEVRISIDTVTRLKQLKLHGMAQSWSELIARSPVMLNSIQSGLWLICLPLKVLSAKCVLCLTR